VRNWVTLTSWRDLLTPELCLPTQYMALRYMLNTTGGPLFPSRQEMSRLLTPGCTDRVCRESMSYETFQTALKAQCVALFGELRKYGTHLCRKSFYLLSKLAGADPAEIQRCARHQSAECAQKYMKDNGELVTL